MEMKILLLGASLVTSLPTMAGGKPISPNLFGIFFLTSSLRTPKIFIKEFSYFLMPCHQHCLGVNLLVQR